MITNNICHNFMLSIMECSTFGINIEWHGFLGLLMNYLLLLSFLQCCASFFGLQSITGSGTRIALVLKRQKGT